MLTNRESASTEPLVARPRWRQPISTVLTGESPANRECPVCPPWVVACAHFEGVAVLLYDVSLMEDCPAARPGPTRHRVSSLRGTWITTSCGHLGYEGGRLCESLATDDLDSAQQEFDKRAAELIG